LRSRDNEKKWWIIREENNGSCKGMDGGVGLGEI